jgi:aromatic-amino-acid transaminase
MAQLIPSHQARPTDDPIFSLNTEAKKRASEGHAVVNATIGAAMDDSGKLSVMQTALGALRGLDDLSIAAYAPISGAPAFLNALLDDLFALDAELRASAVAVATPGGTGALKQAISNFLEPGQAMLTTSFYWSPYQTIADEAGCKVETFNMLTEQGGFDVQAMKTALADQVKKQGRALLFINDPCQNPTGYTMSDADWSGTVEALLEASTLGPVTLLVDTAYMAYSPTDARKTFSKLKPLLGKVGLLVAWSASKTYAAYGLRVGAIVALAKTAEERKQLEAAFAYTSRGSWSNCNHSGLAAIGKLMSDASLREACDRERDQIKDTLFRRVAAFNQAAQAAKLKYPRYEGGFFVTVFHPDAHTKAIRMKEDGVFVVPQKGALRVALCSVAERDVPKLVASLAKP